MHMRAPGCKLSIMTVAVVLVEGISDQLALEALAARRGLNLDGEGIAILPMGGS
jgi:predicted ATP-dependent endonuclease of OLD family